MDSSTAFSTTATFDVPFCGYHPGHAIPYENPLHALRDLMPYPEHIRRLTLGPIPILAFAAVHETLSSFHQLSALEELRVLVWYPHDPPRAQDIPELDLTAAKFPSLRTLSLDGVCADWESDVFSQLSRVELRNCPGFGLTALFDFLGVLPKWSSLTELHLSKFLTVTDRNELMLEDTGYIMRPPNLRMLVVDDRIYQMSHILYNLDVPGPGARVRLIGYAKDQDADDERSPFAAMMPFDDNFPTIFKTACHAELVVTTERARLLGVSPRGILTLEVPDLDGSGEDALPNAFRSALTSLVDIFAVRSTPLSTLALIGDISTVSEQEWGAVFQTVCPRLHELVVRDTGKGIYTHNLFNALTHVFERNQTVAVCPSLERLKFSGNTDPSGNLLGLVKAALRLRAEGGRSPLHCFELELFVGLSGCLPSSNARELYRQELTRWVRDEVRVEVRPLQARA